MYNNSPYLQLAMQRWNAGVLKVVATILLLVVKGLIALGYFK
jgi:hypothetical protein